MYLCLKLIKILKIYMLYIFSILLYTYHIFVLHHTSSPGTNVFRTFLKLATEFKVLEKKNNLFVVYRAAIFV